MFLINYFTQVLNNQRAIFSLKLLILLFKKKNIIFKIYLDQYQKQWERTDILTS